MKIVHVTTASPFSENYAYQENLLAHYHRKMGHDVTIIAPIYSSVNLDETEPVGVRWLEDGSKLVRIPPLINNKLIYLHLQLVKGLKNTILAETPDLIFVHALGCFSYRCLPIIKKICSNVKIVIDNHADLINSLHSPITQFLHKVLYRYTLVPSLVNVVDWFYGVTPSRCDFLKNIYGIPEEKIKLLVMGADDEKMNLERREEIRNETRDRYGIRNNDFLVVTGGKIDRLKNIHELAHAVNSIGRDNVKLLIFGAIEKGMRQIFDEEHSVHIIEAGWVKSDKVYEFFYAADLVVFPGLHSVLWEQAVASKTPCAFSKIDGFNHLNVNDNCIFMDGKDSLYYENMIRKLIETPEQYARLKENSLSSKVNKFNYSYISQQVLQDVGLLEYNN